MSGRSEAALRVQLSEHIEAQTALHRNAAAVEHEKTQRLLAAISDSFHGNVQQAITTAVTQVAIHTVVPAVKATINDNLSTTLVQNVSGALSQGFNAVQKSALAHVNKTISSAQVASGLSTAVVSATCNHTGVVCLMIVSERCVG